MSASQRERLLERLNTLDTGPTEDERRARREATIRKALRTEEELKWGRFSAGGMWGIFGRSASYR